MWEENFGKAVAAYWEALSKELFGKGRPIRYDWELLAWLRLPFDAGETEIKSRFRTLAMRLHPDVGGAARFIELMELYRSLQDRH